jgi:hypothetical protein
MPMSREKWQFFAFTARMAMLSTLPVAPVGVTIAWCMADRMGTEWGNFPAYELAFCDELRDDSPR